MGVCIRARYGRCGYRSAGLPYVIGNHHFPSDNNELIYIKSCPLQAEDSTSEPIIQTINHFNACHAEAAFNSFTDLRSLSLSRRPSIDCDQLPGSKKPRISTCRCHFLNLPGEIRNQIYRFALLSERPFAVQLQFAPLDTALLRVNKQIYAEASTIFYHESVFRFPQPLFMGPPILEQLDNFYHLSLAKLRMIRNFILEVPVNTFHIALATYRF